MNRGRTVEDVYGGGFAKLYRVACCCHIVWKHNVFVRGRAHRSYVHFCNREAIY